MSHFFSIEGYYKDYIKRLGIDFELVMKKAGLVESRFTENGISLSKEEYIALMYSIDEIAGINYALYLGNVEKAARFIPALFAAMCSKDGESCYHRISKYKQLIGPFVLSVVKDEHFLHLEFVFDDYKTPIPRLTVMLEQVLMTGIIRQATGLAIQPAKATSVYAYNDRINEYLGIEGIQSERNVLSFHLKDVREPFLTKNNTMWGYLEPELTKRLEELNVDDSVSARVRTVLFEQIPAGYSNINEIARFLAMSPRTLQRKLKDENTTFIQQLNHTRELMARNYLKDRQISNDEIAFLIGYSDANAFSRAFRGWTGQTIGEYRKLMC